MDLGPNQSPSCSVIKVLLEHSHTYLEHGCFMEELRSCGRNYLAHKAETIYYPVLYSKKTK